MWDSKAMPYLRRKAGALPEILAAARQNLDEAGRKYGYREKQDGSPWTVVTKFRRAGRHRGYDVSCGHGRRGRRR